MIRPVIRKAIIFCTTAILLAGGLALAVAGGWAMIGESNEQSVELAMANGGYVIYLRYAEPPAGTMEPSTAAAAFADCPGGSGLTAVGHAEAVPIDQAFQSLGVPVGAVFTLPLCRAPDRGQSASRRAATENASYDPDIVGRLLAQKPPVGTNTVLVDSGDRIRQLAGIQLQPGEAAIFKPDGKGGFRYDGTLDREDLVR